MTVKFGVENQQILIPLEKSHFLITIILQWSNYALQTSPVYNFLNNHLHGILWQEELPRQNTLYK